MVVSIFFTPNCSSKQYICRREGEILNMASGRAVPWFCWRMVAATIRFPKTGASQQLGFAIQSEKLWMTLGSLRTPNSTWENQGKP